MNLLGIDIYTAALFYHSPPLTNYQTSAWKYIAHEICHKPLPYNQLAGKNRV